MVRGGESAVKAAILDFFHVPEAVRAEFWREVLQKNHLSLVVICIMILGMELYNMARVLLWSSSGLGTLNNRIYFGFYASLFLSAILCLLLEHALRQAAPMRRWAAQYGSMLFFFLWHAVLNAYDLMRDPYGSTGIFVTAVLALAVFIHMPWTFSIPAYGLAYGLFFLLAGKHLAGGDLLNLTFTTIVSLAVSLTTSRNLVIMVSQRRQIDEANAQLQELLERDPLTGLLNKVAFQSCAERILEDGERGQDLTLLLLDLDDFKGINDHYGHPCGDDVLVHTAQALRQVFPEAAGIGRVGGDEFAVLLRDQAGWASERIDQGLLPALARFRWEEKPLQICCSTGICRTDRAGVSYRALYEAADRALYEAKGQGKGRACACVLDGERSENSMRKKQKNC